MKAESWIFGLTGVFFGLLIGWIIATQMARPLNGLNPSLDAAAASGAGSGDGQPAQSPAGGPGGQGGQGQGSTAVPVDEVKMRDLVAQANQRPKDAAVRAQIGNLYFDAERYAESIKWYEESLAIDPRSPDVSTDLGVAYYYTNQTDRALQQFAHSLDVNPKHTKTMLNIGMVRAFGKQDLVGAAASWQQVVDLAPDSPEGRAARQALDTLKQVHPESIGGAGSTPPASSTPPPRAPASPPSTP